MRIFSKIYRICAKLQICLLAYVALFNVFNVNAAFLQRLEPSRFLRSSDVQSKNLCCAIDQINMDNVLSAKGNVKKLSYNRNTQCHELFSDIVRIQNYDCVQNKCFDENISNKFITEISRIFLDSIYDFFYNMQEILYKFGNLQNANCKSEIKQITENEINDINTDIAKLENFIIDKDKNYTTTYQDYISKFHDRQSRVVALHETSMDGFNTLVLSLKNIFLDCVYKAIDLFPKNNIQNNTDIKERYNFMYKAYDKMATKMYDYTIKPNESLIKQINIIYAFERHDKEESDRKAKESEIRKKQVKEAFLQMIRHPFNIDTGQSINPDLFPYWT